MTVTQPRSVAAAIDAAKAENRAALIGYLPTGYPDLDTSVAAMVAMVEGGCDVIEIGVPYSDPVMDGPTVQQAAEVAVQNGTSLGDTLTVARAVADAGAVALVMSYWNPVDRYGVQRFAEDLAGAGGSGVITPDLIPDEAADWIAASEQTGLDRVFLVAPSSTDARVVSTAAASRGFVYAASTMGVTGTRATIGSAAGDLVARVRRLAPDTNVCVGIGVSNGDQAAEVAGFADGVIVGSAFVRRMLDDPGPGGVAAVRDFAAELAEGVRRR
ncbi:tryptophan synthase subunit alpha [Jatrophihabitans sp. YIM 134969]